MAKKIILKENGLVGSSTTPSGYKFIGDNDGNISQKVGATVSEIGGISGYSEMKIGVSQPTFDSNLVVTTFFNNTGETLEFVRYGIGYYAAEIPESMWNLFIENMMYDVPFDTSGNLEIFIYGGRISLRFELDGERYLQIRTAGLIDSNWVDDDFVVFGSSTVFMLPTIYVK